MSAADFGLPRGPWSARHVRGNNFAVQEFDIRGTFGDKPATYPIFNKSLGAIDGATVFTSPVVARAIAEVPNLIDKTQEGRTLALCLLVMLRQEAQSPEFQKQDKKYQRAHMYTVA